MWLTWLLALLTLRVPVFFERQAGRARSNLPKHQLGRDRRV